MWRMEGNVVQIETPRKGAQMAGGRESRLAPSSHKAARARSPSGIRTGRVAPEENAELVKRLAEEIRKAADEYQRMMRVVH